MGSSEVECEYCFKREKELCSPMVIDLSPEEAQEFLKQQETVSNSSGRGVPPVPVESSRVRFPSFRLFGLILLDSRIYDMPYCNVRYGSCFTGNAFPLIYIFYERLPQF